MNPECIYLLKIAVENVRYDWARQQNYIRLVHQQGRFAVDQDMSCARKHPFEEFNAAQYFLRFKKHFVFTYPLIAKTNWYSNKFSWSGIQGLYAIYWTQLIQSFRYGSTQKGSENNTGLQDMEERAVKLLLFRL